MPLTRKAGYGLCIDSSSKKLIRLDDGWFSINLLGGNYCAKTGVTQYINNSSDYSGLQTFTWNLLWSSGSADWISTGSSLAVPLYAIGRAKAITRNYPYVNEVVQIHTANQFQFPALLTGYNITGARLWLESPGETYRDFLRNSSYILYSDVCYAQEVADIAGALNVRFSTTRQLPRFAWDGFDLSISIDELSNNSWASVGVEYWNPFAYAGLSRFGAGGWSFYDLSTPMVTWLNENRTFFMHTNWTTNYAPYFYVSGYSNYTYTRTIRGIVLQVYCEF